MSSHTLHRSHVEIRSSRGEARSPVAFAVFLMAYLVILGVLVLPKGALIEHHGATAAQVR